MVKVEQQGTDYKTPRPLDTGWDKSTLLSYVCTDPYTHGRLLQSAGFLVICIKCAKVLLNIPSHFNLCRDPKTVEPDTFV